MVKVFIIMPMVTVMKVILSMISVRDRELIIIIMDVPIVEDIKKIKNMVMAKKPIQKADFMKVSM